MIAEEKAKEYFDFYNEEIEAYKECPKCGRSYDELQFDLQYCKVCGWDAENKKWCKPIKPNISDYVSGEADILTGIWI